MTEQQWQHHPEPAPPTSAGQEPRWPGGGLSGGPDGDLSGDLSGDPGGDIGGELADGPPVLRSGWPAGPEVPPTAAGRPVLVAWFADEAGARSCLRSLERRGVAVRLAEEAPPEDAGLGEFDGVLPAAEQDSAALTERGMGRGAVLGATVGATAGFLVANYLVPPLGAASATGAMLTTLAGAGLGSFFGNLADQARDASGRSASGRRGAAPAPAGPPARFRLEVRAHPEQMDELTALVSAWDPEEMRLLPTTRPGEPQADPARTPGGGPG